jgi:hypothetical protein
MNNKLPTGAAVAIIVVAVLAIGFVVMKFVGGNASANDMSGELPKSKSNLPDMPKNPYAAEAMKGKGGRTPPPAGTEGQ